VSTATVSALSAAQASIQRRRILVIPGEYPDLNDPRQFNGNWAEEQVRALSAYHDVAVVYPSLTEDRGRIEECLYHGVRTVTVHYRHVRKTWVASYLAAAWRGFQYARAKLKPDCIHAHALYPSGFAAVLIGRALGIPVVVTEHHGQIRIRTSESRLIKRILRFTLRRATLSVAVSEHLAEEMCELEPRASVAVVPNVIAPNFLEPVPARAHGTRETCELLFVGSIRDNRKGLEELLRALRLYLDMPGSQRARLTIIGDGRRRKWFEELAETLGLGDRCRFMGSRSREEVARAMMEADVFVMPSKYETFGVVYAEAMASGKPVIACLGGPAEKIVPPWAGALVPPGDTQAIAQAIKEVVNRLDDYDGRRISEYARENFGPDAVAMAVSRVYEQAIKNKG
jgi:glycosyltransferase involved in cell wall biosynthesis